MRNKEIGWSQEAKLLQEILKELEKIIKVASRG